MFASELDYDLPPERIAQYPLPERDGSRLLVVPRVRDGEPPGELRDSHIRQLAELVPANALLVLNDTRVMKARVFGERVSGAKVELLFLGASRTQPDTWEALVRANRRLPVGDVVLVGEHRVVVGEGTVEGARLVTGPVEALIEQHGHVPLPPYVRREDETSDLERYQTVYARQLGSAAAPTAGLHVTGALLAELEARGVEIEFATLHVGAGTFRPVSTERLDDHPMHQESYSISVELASKVNAAKAAGRPVVAVGTTVVRALESAAARSAVGIAAGSFETRLLISPGYRFLVVDGLLTNFHAPRSTLLALVFAFAGTEQIRVAYAEAIARGYRFLSYGDAMWIPPRLNPLPAS